MFKILLFCFTVCLFQSDDPSFVWKASDKLTWADFKGVPDLNTDAVAVTASGITFSYSVSKEAGKIVSFKTRIQAHFYPENSWFKKADANNYILSHEQLHFDITELYARRFKERVSKFTVSHNIIAQLKASHEAINTELKNRQHKYDKETNSSINKEAQAQWQQQINKELNQLIKYKS